MTSIRIFFFLIVSCFYGQLHSQDYYFAFFTDKDATTFSLDEPDEFLSSRAIERREKFYISLDTTDLPVNSAYIDTLNSNGFNVFAASKWMNGVIFSTERDPEEIEQFDFVKSLYSTIPLNSAGIPVTNRSLNRSQDSLSYGMSRNQIEMIGADDMHRDNFTGEGILIGVLDAGFIHSDSLAVFDEVNEEGRIVLTADIAERNSEVFDDGSHGTAVLSCMASKLPNQIYGTAPDASYALIRTEVVESESRIEEFFWLIGAEKADSLGVDIINSSLGYKTFDDSLHNYSYEQLDGKTTIVAQAAQFALDKGIVVVNSAGNSGRSIRKFIGSPADVPGVISVGAVDSSEVKARFSSFGPNAAGFTKPDLCAQGQLTVFSNINGNIVRGNGTSFSSPIIAGFVAGLLQKYPHLKPSKLKEFLLLSCDGYQNPNDSTGYGIPDYHRFSELADQYVGIKSQKKAKKILDIFPNPSNGHSIILQVENKEIAPNTTIQLYNVQGKQFTSSYKDVNRLLPSLADGVYYIRVDNYEGKWIKQ